MLYISISHPFPVQGRDRAFITGVWHQNQRLILQGLYMMPLWLLFQAILPESSTMICLKTVLSFTLWSTAKAKLNRAGSCS